MSTESKRLGILGGGRFGRIIADLAASVGEYERIVYFDDYLTAGEGGCIGGLADAAARVDDGTVTHLVVGIGYKHFDLRESLYVQYKDKAQFATLIHPSCSIHPEAKIGAGSVVLSMCNVEFQTEVGANVAIFNGTSITHEVSVGDHSFISVAVGLAGGASIGKRTFVGVNATIINDIRIGDDCVVCAATAVTKSVADGTSVIGSPMKIIDRPRL